MIKNAITYNVQLPSESDNFREFILDESMIKKPETNQRLTVGFGEKFNERVIDFSGGYVFFIEIWEKKPKASIIKRLTDEKVIWIEKTEDRVVGRKEKSDLKEEIIYTQITKTEPERTVVTCFYHIGCGLLILDTVNTNHSDLATSHLISTVGSIKATTIYIDQSKGVTQRVAEMIEGDNNEYSFMDNFIIDGLITLASPHGEQVQFKGSHWAELREDSEKQVIHELITESNYSVTQLRLTDDYMAFTLSKDFKFSQIKFAGTGCDDSIEDPYTNFQTDCFHDVSHLVLMTKAMAERFTVIKE